MILNVSIKMKKIQVTFKLTPTFFDLLKPCFKKNLKKINKIQDLFTFLKPADH